MSQSHFTSDEPPARSGAFYRRIAIAPVCLCLVAGLHLYRVAVDGQTPWKGGGFGMFSTVDSESARYLRCYLVTSNGTDLPLAVPGALAKRAAELRAAPSPDAASQLAEKLGRRCWAQPTARSLAEGAWVRTHLPGRPLSAERFAALGSRRSSEVADLPPGALIAAEAFSADRSTGPGIDYLAIRVEVWKYEFDPSRRQLSGGRLFAVTQPRSGTREANHDSP